MGMLPVSPGTCRESVVSHLFSRWHYSLQQWGRDQTVHLWDVETGKSKEVFEIPVNWALSIALSPDGKMLATGSDRTSVKFWDVATGRCLRILPNYTSEVWAVVFSPGWQSNSLQPAKIRPSNSGMLRQGIA